MNKATGKQTLISLIALVLALALILGGAKVYERLRWRNEEAALQADAERMQRSLWTMDNTLVLDGDEYGFDHRLETFLFLGTDNGGGTAILGSDKTNQPMADFLLLMILDHTANSISYLQIDRNTITPVAQLDAEGEIMMYRDLQICTANWFGSDPEMGAENTVRAVKEYLGELENIDGYYVLNMDDIHLLNQAVGGVDILVDEDVANWKPGLTLGSTYTMTDEEAESYLRARVDVGEGTNAERMSRQRNYMSSLFSKVEQKASSDASFALGLWDMLKSAACTNMNGNDFSRIAQKLVKGEKLGIHTIEGTTRLGYKGGTDGLHEEFYPSMDSLKAELTELFSLIPLEAEEEEEEDSDDEDEEDDDDEDEDDDDELDDDEED